jgi:aminomethyltransferase
MCKKTYLYDEHTRLGGKIVDFAGWLLPVQYVSIREEHLAVRQSIGIFDVSHMGEIRVQGPKALAFLESITTNLVSRLSKNQAQYNLLPNSQGGLVDDIYVYCLEPQTDYLICVNAANDDKDWAWIKSWQVDGVELSHESQVWSQIAIQGPKAPEVLSHVLHPDCKDLKKNTLIRGTWNSYEFIYAVSGYTGEAGGEVFIRNEGVVALWKALLEYSDVTVTPCGLGARDTLRTEMGFSLYGHEIRDDLNPLAAGLGWVIKSKDKEFKGKASILDGVQGPKNSKLCGLIMKDKAIPRSGYKLLSQSGEELGWVTSGTYSPSLEKGIALGYVAAPFTSIGTQILVDVRGRNQEAEICPVPFIKKK